MTDVNSVDELLSNIAKSGGEIDVTGKDLSSDQLQALERGLVSEEPTSAWDTAHRLTSAGWQKLGMTPPKRSLFALPTIGWLEWLKHPDNDSKFAAHLAVWGTLAIFAAFGVFKILMRDL